jgi:hypothetical protein
VPEETTLTGSSFESFEDAATQAFASVQGDPNREGLAFATVRRLWLEKGGIVGRIQFHVDLET